MTSKASDEDFTLTIRGSGAGEYLLLAESPDEKEPESFRAFVSTVDGEKFLNIRDEEWILVNYRVSGDLLRLRLVDDELFEISRTRGSMAGRRKATGTGSWSGAGPEPRAVPAREAAGRLHGCQPPVDLPFHPQQVHQIEGAGPVTQVADIAERQEDFGGAEAVLGQVERKAAIA